MPVRAKAEEYLSRKLIGPQWFRHDEVQSMGAGDYEAVQEFVQEVYSHLVEHIDWNRVLLEAMSRHIALEHDDKFDGGPCGDCVHTALLTYERPYVPRDWENANAPISDRSKWRWAPDDDLIEKFAEWVRDRKAARDASVDDVEDE